MESEQMKVVFRQGKIALLDTPNEYIVASLDERLKKRKIPYQVVGSFNIPVQNRQEIWFDTEITRAEI